MPLYQSSGRVAVALASLMSVLWLAEPKSQDAASIVISYSAPAEVVLHQPIVAQLLAQNTRQEPVRLRLGLGATRSFVVKIVRPDGVVIQAPSVPKVAEGGYDTGDRSVPPLGRYTHPLVLNEWFPFDQPGTYRVEIDLVTAIETSYGTPVPGGTRGVMTVRVGKLDQSALHGICQELVERIKGTNDLSVRYYAAVELANVTHSVALPYITQVLDFTDTVDSELITALVRMDTLDARTVLAEMAHGLNEGRASQATNALHELTVNRKR